MCFLDRQKGEQVLFLGDEGLESACEGESQDDLSSSSRRAGLLSTRKLSIVASRQACRFHFRGMIDLVPSSFFTVRNSSGVK